MLEHGNRNYCCGMDARQEALEAVSERSAALKAAQTALEASVAAARRSGASWQAIADRTGLTRQGATKRYAGIVDPQLF